MPVRPLMTNFKTTVRAALLSAWSPFPQPIKALARGLSVGEEGGRHLGRRLPSTLHLLPGSKIKQTQPLYLLLSHEQPLMVIPWGGI